MECRRDPGTKTRSGPFKKGAGVVRKIYGEQQDGAKYPQRNAGGKESVKEFVEDARRIELSRLEGELLCSRPKLMAPSDR